MKAMQRIGLLLSLVFLLPALFFSVYEISTLNKDEEMIQEIYTKQLEAILFSINQYSDDILNSWISKIEHATDVESGQGTGNSELNEFLTLNSSVQQIFLTDTLATLANVKIVSLNDSSGTQLTSKIVEALSKHRDQIQQLVKYKKSGFQKLDTLTFSPGDSQRVQCIIFLTENSNEKLHMIGLLIDPETFIQDLVGPRLQVVARDQFILSAFKGAGNPIYSTQRSDSVSAESNVLTRNFWLFPTYTIGIQVKGTSLEKLIWERTSTNLVLLLLLDVVLVAAVLLVFRNVKKEVLLAQSKAEFVSNVSHEIRTPLALISMFSETLEMGRVKTEEKKQEYYRIISKETQRLTGIVNRILNFSQTEANKKALHVEVMHANSEIKAVLATYDFHLVNKGFEYTLAEKDDLWIKADKEAFVESVINLIDNAVKYSSDTKRIEITLTKENDMGRVIVKDYGVGISKADQKHIFEKFYRVSSGNLAKAGGTGLGLSLVHQLMTAQNGKISVRSEPGKGSEFILFYPLATNP